MKRIIIIVVLVFVVILGVLLYTYEAKNISEREFREITEAFETFVTLVDVRNQSMVRERLEMSREEYEDFKQTLETTWEAIPAENVNVEKRLFSEEERKGEREVFFAKSVIPVPLGLAKYSCWETLIAIVHDDRVYIEYSAELKRPRGLLGLWR